MLSVWIRIRIPNTDPDPEYGPSVNPIRNTAKWGGFFLQIFMILLSKDVLLMFWMWLQMGGEYVFVDETGRQVVFQQDQVDSKYICVLVGMLLFKISKNSNRTCLSGNL